MSARDATTQERYVRLVAASGLRPDIDVSPAAQLALAGLDDDDDATIDALVELLDAVRATGRRRGPNAPGAVRLARTRVAFTDDRGPSGP